MGPLEWEKFYRETEEKKMPWYYPGLDPDLEAALHEMNITGGSLLDIGTGPGTQALALARLGFKVTATDVSETAITLCRAKAREMGLDIKFIDENILHSTLSPGFDVIFDRGCFHALRPTEREHYTEVVHALLHPEGVLFLKCFSVKETMEGGPYRFSHENIRRVFSPYFNILSIKETVYHGTLSPLPKALFITMKQRPKKA